LNDETMIFPIPSLSPATWLKLAGALAVLALVAGAVWIHAGWIDDIRQEALKQGRAEVQAKWDAREREITDARIAASQEARRIETSRQTNVIEAQNAAQTRVKNLQAVVVATAAERDGLRDDLAATTAALPSLAPDACRRYAATANAVLAELGLEAEELARTAQGHANDSLMYQQAWPVDFKPPEPASSPPAE